MEVMDKILGLRAWLAEQGLDGFYLAHGDRFFGEEVRPPDRYLEWLTGFSGSFGVGLILRDRAVIFTDSRYILQIGQQVDGEIFEVVEVSETSILEWLAENYGEEGLKIGFDGWVVSVANLKKLKGGVGHEFSGHEWVAGGENPLDGLWEDRPDYEDVAPMNMFEGVAEKRGEMVREMEAAGAALQLITDAGVVNWLTGIRGRDLEFTPLYLCYGLMTAGGELILIADRGIVDRGAGGPATQKAKSRIAGRAAGYDDAGGEELLGYRLMSVAAFSSYIAAYGGGKILCDPASLPVALHEILVGAGLECVLRAEGLLVKKARKSEAEREGFVEAHILDGVALCRFWYWLECEARLDEIREADIAEALRGFRGESGDYLHDSFATIAGYGAHGAIVHYRAVKGADQSLGGSGVLLVDSGGHYRFGTTDITRCFYLDSGEPDSEGADFGGGENQVPDEILRASSLVLSGHVGLASAVFPVGTIGAQLDGVCRGVLWAGGLDYKHGTGHGVGHVLSVHEGPFQISKGGFSGIEEGYVLSIEPGYYEAGGFGIRYENLYVVRSAGAGFLRFEALSCFPFDRKLIDVGRLSAGHRAWLDLYHAWVYGCLAGRLEPAVAAWLAVKCAAL